MLRHLPIGHRLAPADIRKAVTWGGERIAGDQCVASPSAESLSASLLGAITAIAGGPHCVVVNGVNAESRVPEYIHHHITHGKRDGRIALVYRAIFASGPVTADDGFH